MYVAKISAKRFVNVRTYGGKIMVDIREYYRDQSSGEMKPGKKGASLITPEPYNQFLHCGSGRNYM